MNVFTLKLHTTIALIALILVLVPLATPFTAIAQQNTGQNPPGQATTQSQERSRPSSCDGVRGYINPLCWIKDIVIGLSAMIVYLCALILALAGSLFNLLVDHTIVDFGSWFYSEAMKSALETAWSAFRDIANILIIGMFVFFAISMILGLQEFGRKKMVAKVIIIAILINFSLLFTKVVIDFSNFTAKQFYDAASLKSAEGAGTTGPQNYAQKGIGGKFIEYLGVTTLTQTHDSIRKAAGNDWIGEMGFIHAVISSVLLIATAIVLFYGSFLLISRAILLLFLILTSAIAFAAYLFPSKTFEGGFFKWWNALLRSAIFAPLLMILLWITLTVAEAMKARVSGAGTLGDIVAHPTKSGNLEMLMGYFIILGLLFVSLKVASSFSTQIAGFNWASIAPAFATSFGGKLFSAALTGNRFGIGRGAFLASSALESRAKETKSGVARGLYNLTASAIKPISKADLNPMRTPGLLGAISQTSRIRPDVLAPKRGGWEGQLSRMGKKAAEQEAAGQRPDAAARTAAEQKKVREEARGVLTESTRAARADAGRRADQAEKKEASRMQALKEALGGKGMERDKRDWESAEKEVKFSKEQMSELARATAHDKRDSEAKRSALVEEHKTLIGREDAASRNRRSEVEKQLAMEKSHLARILKEGHEKIEKIQSSHNAAKKKMRDIETKAMATPEFQKKYEAKMGRAEKELGAAEKAQEKSSLSFSQALKSFVSGHTKAEQDRIDQYKIEWVKKAKEEKSPRFKERQEFKKVMEEFIKKNNDAGAGSSGGLNIIASGNKEEH